jgi:lipoyl(octanoyl) transferase
MTVERGQHAHGYEDVNTPTRPGFAAEGGRPIEWLISQAQVDYARALAAMDHRAAGVADGKAAELVWLLEHGPLYTAGTSARQGDLVAARFPVYEAGRGGQFTYHGPGQRVLYLMLDLKRRGGDVRRFVATLEELLIRTLGRFGIRGERRRDRIGVWVARPDKGPGHEDKIAAIGIRVRRWVTLHGVSLNVAPDLGHFAGIVPCGIADPLFGVTSLADLGIDAAMQDVDRALRAEFELLFGATSDAGRQTVERIEKHSP